MLHAVRSDDNQVHRERRFSGPGIDLARRSELDCARFGVERTVRFQR